MVSRFDVGIFVGQSRYVACRLTFVITILGRHVNRMESNYYAGSVTWMHSRVGHRLNCYHKWMWAHEGELGQRQIRMRITLWKRTIPSVGYTGTLVFSAGGHCILSSLTDLSRYSKKCREPTARTKKDHLLTHTNRKAGTLYPFFPFYPCELFFTFLFTGCWMRYGDTANTPRNQAQRGLVLGADSK